METIIRRLTRRGKLCILNMSPKKFAQTVSKPPEVFHECAEKLKFGISSHFVIKHASYGHFRSFAPLGQYNGNTKK